MPIGGLQKEDLNQYIRKSDIPKRLYELTSGLAWSKASKAGSIEIISGERIAF